MIVTANGIELFIEQRGAGAPAFVFLHYWGGSSRTWAPVVDRLTSDYRSVALDQRGWGRSAAPAGGNLSAPAGDNLSAPAGGYALADLADDAQAVIAALDLERYILVGHSMGGKVAQLIASRRPPGLAGLALIAPAPPGPLGLPLAVRQGMVQAYDTRASILATVAQVLAPDGLAPEDLETVIADSLVGAMPAREAWPLASSQEDITGALAHIEGPVLVVSGANDRVDPPEVLRRTLLPLLPQARLHVLPGVGHLLPLEAPDAIAALLHSFAVSLEEAGGQRCLWCGETPSTAARKRLARETD